MYIAQRRYASRQYNWISIGPSFDCTTGFNGSAFGIVPSGIPALQKRNAWPYPRKNGHLSLHSLSASMMIRASPGNTRSSTLLMSSQRPIPISSSLISAIEIRSWIRLKWVVVLYFFPIIARLSTACLVI